MGAFGGSIPKIATIRASLKLTMQSCLLYFNFPAEKTLTDYVQHTNV